MSCIGIKHVLFAVKQYTIGQIAVEVQILIMIITDGVYKAEDSGEKSSFSI